MSKNKTKRMRATRRNVPSIIEGKPIVHKCWPKKLKQLTKDDRTIEYIRSELQDVQVIRFGHTSGRNGMLGKMTRQTFKGQSAVRVWIKRNGKKKEAKTFITHEYCPWCGQKY